MCCCTSFSLKTCSPSSGVLCSLKKKKKKKKKKKISKSQVLLLPSSRMRMRPRNKRRTDDKVLEMINLRLYLENKSIIEENKRLRKRASLLLLENKTLQSHLQTTLQHSPSSSLSN